MKITVPTARLKYAEKPTGKLVIVLAVIVSVILAIVTETSVADAKSDTKWTRATYVKLEKMEGIGFDKKLATYVIIRCKETAKDPARCVTTASMIGKAESNAGQAAYKNNVWGINEGKTYATKEANFERWLKSYNKWWYNSPLPEHYYPAK